MNGLNTSTTKADLPIIYRDDDPCVFTCAGDFKRMHEEVFVKTKTLHTAAIVVDDLWRNTALFYYLITAPYLKVELHAWDHDPKNDFSNMDIDDVFYTLQKCLKYYYTNAMRMLGVQKLPPEKCITTWFTPWNRATDNMIKSCEAMQIKFCNVAYGEWNGNFIKSLHCWNWVRIPEGEPITLEKMLDRI